MAYYVRHIWPDGHWQQSRAFGCREDAVAHALAERAGWIGVGMANPGTWEIWFGEFVVSADVR